MSPEYAIPSLECCCVSVLRCVLQTFAPDWDVMQWRSARTGGGDAPQASGEVHCGDVDQDDSCYRTFSETIALHVCSCFLDPCPCIWTHCLMVALRPCVLVPGSRAPLFVTHIVCDLLLYPRSFQSSHTTAPSPTPLVFTR